MRLGTGFILAEDRPEVAPGAQQGGGEYQQDGKHIETLTQSDVTLVPVRLGGGAGRCGSGWGGQPRGGGVRYEKIRVSNVVVFPSWKKSLLRRSGGRRLQQQVVAVVA